MDRRWVLVIALVGCGRWRFGLTSDDAGDDSGIDAGDTCGFHAIDVGDRFSCAIDKNDDVWCWGANDFEQIVVGGPRYFLAATKIGLPGPVAQLRAGGSFACARLTSGDVWCWGRNNHGYLGNGTVGANSAPVQVALGGETAIDLDVGGGHTCIRRSSDSAVMCWGENKSFALGNTGPLDQPSPVLVAGTAGAKQLATGHRHTCIIDSADHPVCWGRQRTEGRLGNNGTSDKDMPMPIAAVPTATNIAAGNRLTCTIAPGGGTRCFGERYLGGASFDTFDASALVGDGVQLALGSNEGCVRRTDGTVACWGYVALDGRTELSTTAVASSLTNVTDIQAGWYHYCALADGRPVCWSGNQDPSLGRGELGFVAAPQPVTLPGPVTQIVSDGVNACAVANGRLYCWGLSYGGELGDTTTRAAYLPRELATGLPSIDGITDGCAWGGGVARCWGQNDGGQLGQGTTDMTLHPPTSIPGAPMVGLATGSGFACARTASQVLCWGRGTHGKLGYGGTADSPSPTAVSGVNNPTAMDAHGETACAIAGGQLSCWGRNDAGQVGDGSTTDQPTPVPVALSNSVVAVSRGNDHTCAIDAIGDLYCWGAGTYGELGLGDTASHPTPTKVPLVGAVSRVSANDNGTCAELVNGNVYCWGRGAEGQNANGTFDQTSTPTLAPALAGATGLARSNQGGCAIVGGGAVCWGNRNQLGDGDDSSTRALPVQLTCQ